MAFWKPRKKQPKKQQQQPKVAKKQEKPKPKPKVAKKQEQTKPKQQPKPVGSVTNANSSRTGAGSQRYTGGSGGYKPKNNSTSQTNVSQNKGSYKRQSTSNTTQVNNAYKQQMTQPKPKSNVPRHKSNAENRNNLTRTNTSFNGDFLSVDLSTDYNALKQEAEARGDYASAAKYEAQRNAKINYMNQMGTNANNYQTTSDHINQYMEAGFGTGRNNEGGISYGYSEKSFDDLGADGGTLVKNGIRYKRDSDGKIYQDVGTFGDGSTHWYMVGDGVNPNTGEFTFSNPKDARRNAYDQYLMSGGRNALPKDIQSLQNDEIYNYIDEKKLVDDGYKNALGAGTVGEYNAENVRLAQEEIDRRKRIIEEEAESNSDRREDGRTRESGDISTSKEISQRTPNFDFSYLDDEYARQQRANYIAQQRSLNQAQDMLSAMGYSGGFSESSLNDINSEYLDRRYEADQRHNKARQEAYEEAQRLAQKYAADEAEARFNRDYKMQMLGLEKAKFDANLEKWKREFEYKSNNDRYKQAMDSFQSNIGAYSRDYQAEIDRLKNLQSQGVMVDSDGINIEQKILRLNAARNIKLQEQEKMKKEQGRYDAEQAEKKRQFDLNYGIKQGQLNVNRGNLNVKNQNLKLNQYKVKNDPKYWMNEEYKKILK